MALVVFNECGSRVLASAGVWFYLRIDKPDFSLFKRIDFLGLLYLALFLGPLEYILEEGPGDEWFDSTFILMLSMLCACSALGFFARAFRVTLPIVDLRVFRDRNFAIGASLGFIIGIALYGMVYLMPLFLGTVRGFNSFQIGQLMFVTGASMFSAHQ
ncbi:hypothetical protein P4S73_18125 [Paraglaciecola sp. Hal342]